MKVVDTIALLSEISNHNNLGTTTLRDGTMNHRRDGSSLIAFDVAIAELSIAVSAVRGGLQSINGGGSDDGNNNNIFVSSSPVSYNSTHEARKKRNHTSRCEHCPSHRPKNADRFCASSLPIQNPQLAATRTKIFEQRRPPTIEEEASNHCPVGSTEVLERGPQQKRSPLISLLDLRNAILNDVDRNNHSYLPSQSASEECAFVYEGPITMDPLELRKRVASLVMSTGRGEIDLNSPDQQHTGVFVDILQNLLFKMSIIVIYNLGLAYHLKSIRERAEFSQASSSSAAPMDMSRSTSFLTSLQKAQVLYSMASRHLTHLPSWKFKLALLNNLGQVYSERNLGDNARPCFEAVCRHISKIAYQCSRSSALIPFSSDGNGHHISDDMGTEKLLQALMMAALMKLLAKPHAGVA